MVIMEAYRFSAENVRRTIKARECLLADVGQVQVQAENRVAGDTQLVSKHLHLVPLRRTSADTAIG